MSRAKEEINTRIQLLSLWMNSIQKLAVESQI